MNVLIVEDDPAVRHALADVLRAEGYGVCMASTCSGALRLLATEYPALVLLDIDLGEMELSGLDVARFMRNDPAWKKIPIIITSGLPAEEIRTRATTYAFDGLRCAMVEKPVDLGILISTIRTMI